VKVDFALFIILRKFWIQYYIYSFSSVLSVAWDVQELVIREGETALACYNATTKGELQGNHHQELTVNVTSRSAGESQNNNLVVIHSYC